VRRAAVHIHIYHSIHLLLLLLRRRRLTTRWHLAALVLLLRWLWLLPGPSVGLLHLIPGRLRRRLASTCLVRTLRMRVHVMLLLLLLWRRHGAASRRRKGLLLLLLWRRRRQPALQTLARFAPRNPLRHPWTANARVAGRGRRKGRVTRLASLLLLLLLLPHAGHGDRHRNPGPRWTRHGNLLVVYGRHGVRMARWHLPHYLAMLLLLRHCCVRARLLGWRRSPRDRCKHPRSHGAPLPGRPLHWMPRRRPRHPWHDPDPAVGGMTRVLLLLRMRVGGRDHAAPAVGRMRLLPWCRWVHGVVARMAQWHASWPRRRRRLRLLVRLRGHVVRLRGPHGEPWPRVSPPPPCRRGREMVGGHSHAASLWRQTAIHRARTSNATPRPRSGMLLGLPLPLSLPLPGGRALVLLL